jgi:hypothetical protein
VRGTTNSTHLVSIHWTLWAGDVWWYHCLTA